MWLWYANINWNIKDSVQIQGQFENNLPVYTGGSNEQGQIAAAAVCQQLKFNICIFTLEPQAFFLALGYIKVSNCTKYVV